MLTTKFQINKMNEQKKRRTEITIETHSITIIRTSERRYSTYCKSCQKTVTAFPIAQIAAFLRLDLNEVCSRIENQKLHLTETGRGVALICATSLEGKEN